MYSQDFDDAPRWSHAEPSAVRAKRAIASPGRAGLHAADAIVASISLQNELHASHVTALLHASREEALLTRQRIRDDCCAAAVADLEARAQQRIHDLQKQVQLEQELRHDAEQKAAASAESVRSTRERWQIDVAQLRAQLDAARSECTLRAVSMNF